ILVPSARVVRPGRQKAGCLKPCSTLPLLQPFSSCAVHACAPPSRAPVHSWTAARRAALQTSASRPRRTRSRRGPPCTPRSCPRAVVSRAAPLTFSLCLPRHSPRGSRRPPPPPLFPPKPPPPPKPPSGLGRASLTVRARPPI